MPDLAKMFAKMSQKPLGKKLFSMAVCRTAPYFSTIKPTFVDLRAGYCEITMRKRKAVQNHIGTVHAIAMCNICELAGGTMTDATIPKTHRWLPKGMTVEYLKKAETNLRAVAQLDEQPEWTDAQDFLTTVNVYDTNNEVVMRAVITMWVSKKKAKAA